MEFYYRAAEASGVIQTGHRSANSREQLVATLKLEGLLPLEVREKTQRISGFLHSSKVTKKDVLGFTQQLSGLLESGIRLSRSLEILSQLSKGGIKAVVDRIRQDLQEGHAFSAALEKHPRIFDVAYITMVRAGEASGKLSDILGRLAETMEQEQEFQGEVMSSLLYPSLVTLVSLVSMVILMTYVIPKFQNLFNQLGQELPLITQFIVTLSRIITRRGLLILFSILIVGVPFALYIRTEKGRNAWDRLALQAPFIGQIIIQIEVERFTRILSLLLRSGVPLLQSLLILRTLMHNRLLARSVAEAAVEVQAGHGIARFLATQDFFPPVATAMIGVGEEAGNLDEMMEQVARIYARDTRQSLQRIVSLLGPILILVLAGVIFFIALAILLPVFKIDILR